MNRPLTTSDAFNFTDETDRISHNLIEGDF